MRSGFSLIEMTVAMLMVLVVTGAVFALMDPVHGAFQAQPRAMDEQQRIRTAAEAITKDLLMAGAGTGKYLAPLLPFRRGPVDADSPAVFFTGRISVLFVPAAAPETIVTVPTDGGSAIYVGPQTGCPAADPLCGFAANTLALIFDETGSYDTFRISALQNAPPALIRTGGSLSKSYSVGAIVAQVVSSTYWVRPDSGAGVSELMKYDGHVTDSPITDDVDGLGFAYYGDPSPPVLRRPLSDPDGPWTSYGPKPPDITVDDPATPSYGPGENCIFAVVDSATVVRPEMEDLGSSSASLVALDSRRLTDGPWCPDPTSPNRFDADLLRVRRVRVTFRVRQQQVTFDVTPRNLSLPQ